MNTAPNPREVLELAGEIVRVEDQLAQLKEKWDSLFTPNVESPRPKQNGRPRDENSVASKVLAVITGDGSKSWDAETMTEHLGADRETVASALYNLYVAKKIERVARGKYSAANPYIDQIESQLNKERNAA